MWWFRKRACLGCDARDQEIRHLLAELTATRETSDKLTNRLMELADPGSVQRLTPRPSPFRRPAASEPSAKPPVKVDLLPGYEPERGSKTVAILEP